VLVDQEGLNDPSKIMPDTEAYHDNILHTSDAGTSKSVSDAKSHHVNITDTSETMSDATVSHPVLSSPCQPGYCLRFPF
jgi:hypothetical protein